MERRYDELIADDYATLSRDDQEAYAVAVSAGNFYEVFSTYDNERRVELGECADTLVLVHPVVIVPGRQVICRSQVATDSLENFNSLMDSPDPSYYSGVRAPDVFSRDIRANHMGAAFGIDAFYFQDVLPPLPPVP